MLLGFILHMQNLGFYLKGDLMFVGSGRVFSIGTVGSSFGGLGSNGKATFVFAFIDIC